eukprot:TRINITY_DN80063_c0_g1_i1.p1 TRINITY_DN80063_c0_g1~~TRINITY_DN80063_c0_g1_i1.p1  ORF type:complete len:611 (-),score=149.59 TRINITY_DN80063_c0_g1_i1:58-1890(-)
MEMARGRTWEVKTCWAWWYAAATFSAAKWQVRGQQTPQAAAVDCPAALEDLAGLHCYGLEVPSAAFTEELGGGVRQRPDKCADACCNDANCEVWQWHHVQGCFVGRPQFCIRTGSAFAREVKGARLRRTQGSGARPSVEKIKGSQFVWHGDESFNTYAAVEPYLDGAQTIKLHASDGETFFIRRHGPGPEHFDLSVSCWSPERQPWLCCDLGEAGNRFGPQAAQAGNRGCWDGLQANAAGFCCKEGVTRHDGDKLTWFDMYIMISNELTTEERIAWDRFLPGPQVDEDAFDKKRLRWRVGKHEADDYCSGAEVNLEGLAFRNRPADLELLLPLLAQGGAESLSGTFVDLGAGGCGEGDPIDGLLRSSFGARFRGLAVEMDASALGECVEHVQRQAPAAEVLPVSITLDPLTVVDKLSAPLERLFASERSAQPGGRWPLDVLVVDIDGTDCSVARELLEHSVRAKIVVLEMVYHIPPPFKFQLQYDSGQDSERLQSYDVSKLNPAAGCSLSYALHQLRPLGYHLLRLGWQDAIFVHDSLAAAAEKSLGVKLPLDEFQCYRKSRLWMQFPAMHVRQWFFAAHPSESIGYIWSNITKVQRDSGRASAPFTLDY